MGLREHCCAQGAGWKDNPWPAFPSALTLQGSPQLFLFLVQNQVLMIIDQSSPTPNVSFLTVIS